MNAEQINKERLELIQKARKVNREREKEQGLHLCGFCNKDVDICNNNCKDRKNRISISNSN
jgi:hypothetical protein